MPISIIVVEKTGVLKTQTIKDNNENELYKKAGLKTAEGFSCQASWNVEIEGTKYSAHVYAKTTGRAGQENKYDFPPPIDQTLFFGSCIIVNKNEAGDIIDLSTKDWETIYEYLFGGFEDIGDEDSEDDSDSDEDDDIPRTKEGYVKDGFIVDDDDDEEDDDEDEDEDEEDDEDDDEDEDVPKKRKPAAKKVVKSKDKKSKTVVENVFIKLKPADDTVFLDCTSELSEEEYFN